jgi:hypothetical protein
MPFEGTLEQTVDRLRETYEPLVRARDAKRFFHGVYLRNTIDVVAEIEAGGFRDGEWLRRWDTVFIGLYLEALDVWNAGGEPPGPWRVAFEAARELDAPPLRHVLVGLNAHINYDLPLSLIACLTDEEAGDDASMERRFEDFRHIDDIVVARVKEEELLMREDERPGDRTLLDRMLLPLNRVASRRMLKEGRAKVWHNTRELISARRKGPDDLAARSAELESVATAKVRDLLEPGQVLLKLAARGFGVTLPPVDARAGR